MFKILMAGLLLIGSALASAEVRPYLNVDVGIGDTDFENDSLIRYGGGIQFNEHVELEINQNDYGDVGPFGLEVTSLSYGLNLGGPISERARMFAIVGSERLEVDDTATVGGGMFSITVDESSSEAFFGLGLAAMPTDSLNLRFRVVGHDSGDLVTFSFGLGLYF